MSISTTQIPEETKEKFYSNKHFKKIVGSSIKSVSKNAINLPLGFSIIATAIGEILNVNLSVKWYLLVTLMLGIYIINLKTKDGPNTKQPSA